MDHIENERFAEIALSRGFCRKDQIQRCLAIQANTPENLSLGQSLLREGFITEEQHSRVLTLIRRSIKEGRALGSPAVPPEAKSMPASDTSSPERWEDDRLGKLAIREGWLTLEDLRACVQAEERRSPRRPLVEILLAGGYLTPARASDLLKRVSRRQMCCRGCEKSFNVLSLARSSEVRCPECGAPLEMGKLPGQPLTKDPLATQTFAALSGSRKAPLPIRPRAR